MKPNDMVCFLLTQIGEERDDTDGKAGVADDEGSSKSSRSKKTKGSRGTVKKEEEKEEKAGVKQSGKREYKDRVKDGSSSKSPPKKKKKVAVDKSEKKHGHSKKHVSKHKKEKAAAASGSDESSQCDFKSVLEKTGSVSFLEKASKEECADIAKICLSQDERFLLGVVSRLIIAYKADDDDAVRKLHKSLSLMKPDMSGKWLCSLLDAMFTRRCLYCGIHLRTISELTAFSKPAQNLIMCAECCAKYLLPESKLHVELPNLQINAKTQHLAPSLKTTNTGRAVTCYVSFIAAELVRKSDRKFPPQSCDDGNATVAKASIPKTKLEAILLDMVDRRVHILAGSKGQSSDIRMDVGANGKYLSEAVPQFVSNIPDPVCEGLQDVVKVTGNCGEYALLKLLILFAQYGIDQYRIDHIKFLQLFAAACGMVSKLEVVAKVLREHGVTHVSTVMIDTMRGVLVSRTKICKELRKFVLSDTAVIEPGRGGKSKKHPPSSLCAVLQANQHSGAAAASAKGANFRKSYSTAGMGLYAVTIPGTNLGVMYDEEQDTRTVTSILTPIINAITTLKDNIVQVIMAQANMERCEMMSLATLKCWCDVDAPKVLKEQFIVLHTKVNALAPEVEVINDDVKRYADYMKSVGHPIEDFEEDEGDNQTESDIHEAIPERSVEDAKRYADFMKSVGHPIVDFKEDDGNDQTESDIHKATPKRRDEDKAGEESDIEEDPQLQAEKDDRDDSEESSSKGKKRSK